MGRGWGRNRGGRRRGAMGRTRGERSGWDGQRHSVLERLGSQNMKGGLRSWPRRGLEIGQIGGRIKDQDGGKRRVGMARCKR